MWYLQDEFSSSPTLRYFIVPKQFLPPTHPLLFIQGKGQVFPGNPEAGDPNLESASKEGDEKDVEDEEPEVEAVRFGWVKGVMVKSINKNEFSLAECFIWLPIQSLW